MLSKKKRYLKVRKDVKRSIRKLKKANQHNLMNVTINKTAIEILKLGLTALKYQKEVGRSNERRAK